MTMQAALGNFLASLAAPVAPVVDEKPAKRSKPVTVKAVEIVKAEVSFPSAPVLVEPSKPADDKVDAAGFLTMLRNAGKRPNANGILVTVAAEVKGDQIKAMTAYKGFSSGKPFGSQLDEAIRIAKSESRKPEDKAPVAPSAAVSVTAYVAGLPRSETQKKIDDLKGRINLYGDAMNEHISKARNVNLPRDVRKHAAISAAFEKARLNETYATLSKILSEVSK